GEHVEDGQRRLRPHALDLLQGHEGAALVAGGEAVEPGAERLRPLGLHVQHRLVARRRQPRKGARPAADDIADAGHVDQRLLLADLGHQAAQPTDHAAPRRWRAVRAWAWAMATASASA